MKNYFKSLIGVAALFLFTLSAVAQAPLQYRVDTIQGLLNVTLYGADAKVTAWVGGGTARDDGLGGVFFYDGNSAVSTNVYAVYKPVNNAGRWFKLPTQVAYQTAAVTVGDDTTYAWKLLRGGQTNFFGIGADNTTVYLQTFNGKTLQINNLGNNTILNATAGNVGIGTATPGTVLNINLGAPPIGSAAANGGQDALSIDGNGADVYLNFRGPSSGAQTAGILFSDGTRAVGALQYNHTSDYMAFTVASGEKVRINSSGNVGIGTTGPNGTLDISAGTSGSFGSASIGILSSNSNVVKNWAIGSGRGSNFEDLSFWAANKGANPHTTGTEVLTLGGGSSATSFNVGIRQSSPASPLSVNGGISAGTYSATAAPSNGMIISGNVGIGTTAPTSLLSVNGATGLSSLVVTNGTTMGSLTVTNSFIVGDAPIGNAIRAIYSAAAQIDFPPVIALSVTNMTMTVTGAGTNSTVTVSSANGTVATANGLTFSAWVNATNTVTIRAANGTLDPWDPASSSYRATVFQY